MTRHRHFINRLQARLQEPLPGNSAHQVMFPAIKAMPEIFPDNMRLSAVMVLLFQREESWYLLAIRRTKDGHAHSGQIGFPGGKEEPGDGNLHTTALRETFEEVGVSKEKIGLIGALSPVFIVVSNFRVFPFVGILEQPVDYIPSKDEVDAILEIPVAELFAPEAKVQTVVTSPVYPDIQRTVNAYRLQDGTIIWGATAMMIAELELIWNEISTKN